MTMKSSSKRASPVVTCCCPPLNNSPTTGRREPACSARTDRPSGNPRIDPSSKSIQVLSSSDRSRMETNQSSTTPLIESFDENPLVAGGGAMPS